MRIVVDMQGAQSESRYRGIGRYTLSFAKAIVRNRGEHDIILVLSGLFPETINPIRDEFAELLPKENIQVWNAPGPVRVNNPLNLEKSNITALVRESFIESLQPDVVHIGSLFEGYVDDAAVSISRLANGAPVSVALYDLIPLMNSEKYLDPIPNYARFYHGRFEDLQNAAVCLAISDSARSEGLRYLSLTENQVVNVATAVDLTFRPLKVKKSQYKQLLARLTINDAFVLYTGGADERKNLPRLIKAFAMIPADKRQSIQLVLVGRMPEGDRTRLEDIASRAGLAADEICFTGYVADEELNLLYNLCNFFVLPSWHEGFGLPALEAMACGAVVIGSNTSSLPEVIG